MVPAEQSACQRPAPCKREWMCRGGGSRRGKMSWLVRQMLPSYIFLIFRGGFRQHPEHSSGKSGTSRNILADFWVPHIQSLCVPVEEASGWSFSDWNEMQPGPWPPPCHEGREQGREKGNLPSRTSSKICICRTSTSLVFSLYHSIVRPFPAGLTLLQCALRQFNDDKFILTSESEERNHSHTAVLQYHVFLVLADYHMASLFSDHI